MSNELPDLSFSDEAVLRYSRHILLPEVGAIGQGRLRDSSILVIGAGGLGSPLALYLAAAGVGRIGIVDHDIIELSNLQRQIIFETQDVGQNKVDRAASRLTNLNPEIEIVTYPVRADRSTLPGLIGAYDLVCDGCDNFQTRYAVADQCWAAGKTLISGAVQRFEGTLSTFAPRKGGPCYRCLYPDADAQDAPSCGEAGIFGSVTGVIGSLMATEALKELLSLGTSMRGHVLLWNALDASFRRFDLPQDPECPCCGSGRQPCA
ncbi:HesA/MoeB/ThiF family protein [Asaia krungthepensis]|uniref:Molybdopterin biosynthesis protein MoeB n=1 Tax=Asaia krungthepensis NRIC 0535 TaxID=1307925 RepID=A0ABQ0PWA4_9PROT|nr:HesA/MoeB/ThiF family protein [Asaia krungthepensis]GBQ83170.1 molybdopterin biosynthesis protein MoeB [Asaia krungthepensis NRIC 0535]